MSQHAFKNAAKVQARLDARLIAEAGSGQADLGRMGRLIAAGADPNCRDKLQRSVLMIAVNARDKAAAALLIDKGADMYAKNGGNDVIFYALAHYDRNMVAMFLDKKFDPNRQPCRGNMTPLMWAANFHKMDLCEELATRGANIHARNPDNNMTAMDYARDQLKPHIAKRLLAIDAENIARAEREKAAEAERVAQERLAAQQAAFDAVCNAGLPLENAVRKMTRIRFVKPNSVKP